MSEVLQNPQKDAVSFHQVLATDWDQRYQKSAFRDRLQAFGECLGGRELTGQQWLDAGCGSGTLARFLAEKGAQVLGVDAAPDMVAAARRLAEEHAAVSRLRFEPVETIAKLPLADQSLDGILCSSVLEYVPEPSCCLAEFSRILRPGGLLLGSVPNRLYMIRRGQVLVHRFGRALRQPWFAFLDYSRHEYFPAQFEGLLHEYGFSVSQVIAFGSPIPHWMQQWRYGGSLLAFCATRD